MQSGASPAFFIKSPHNLDVDVLSIRKWMVEERGGWGVKCRSERTFRRLLHTTSVVANY